MAEENPFLSPFGDIPRPSAWEAITERTKQERQHRRDSLIAQLLALTGVAVSASIAASIGTDGGSFLSTFFSALEVSLLGGVCGGGFCVLLGMLGVTGAFRYAAPVYARWNPQPSAPSGAPMFPLSLAIALLGIFIFTTIGAALGASQGDVLAGDDVILRALLGGVVGMVPTGLWWAYLRHRAGLSIRKPVVVLVGGLACTLLAGLNGCRTGVLDPGRDFSALMGRGNTRYSRGDFNGAVADFSKVIQLKPGFSWAYRMRGLALVRQGKDAEARKDFERYLEMEPYSKEELNSEIEETIRRRQGNQ